MIGLPSERAAVVGGIVPLLRDNVAGALTDAIDMAKWHSVMFVLTVGATDTTTDFKLQESATSAGSYTDITGRAITQLSGTDDNKYAIVNLRSIQLGAGMRFVKGSLTTGDGTTGGNTAVIAIGLEPRFPPAFDDDLAAVAQIV